VKTKPSGSVQVVQKGNNEINMGNGVFQIDELVDAYLDASSTDLKENSIFCVA